MKRFIECLVPITACNMKCSYCYLIQEGRDTQQRANFEYSPKHIAEALSQDRLGGESLISITGSGETLIPKEIPLIVDEILKQGHFINITTNGTLTKRFQEIIDITGDSIDRVHFSFSLHYVELLDSGWLETFFDNIELVKKAGASILVQINLSDEYFDEWEKIGELVKSRTGALPQVALTRDEHTKPFSIMTKVSDEEYIAKGREMNSPLFDFTVKNFNKKQTSFCYAGDWSAKLNLGTGEMSGCYGLGVRQNIFKDLSKPIKFAPIGNACHFGYCFNSSHFLSLGCIPNQITPSYSQLRNREEGSWQSEKMSTFLNQKLSKSNNRYSWKVRLNFTIKTHYLFYSRIFKKVLQHFFQ